jgi:hypothetical protein
MCAVEQDDARLLPETKQDLVHHIMKVDEMESEEFPMSPETIARDSVVVSYIPPTPRYNTNVSYTNTRSYVAQP